MLKRLLESALRSRKPYAVNREIVFRAPRADDQFDDGLASDTSPWTEQQSPVRKKDGRWIPGRDPPPKKLGSA